MNQTGVQYVGVLKNSISLVIHNRSSLNLRRIGHLMTVLGQVFPT